MGELVHLHADEEEPAEHRHRQPADQHLPVALLGPVQGQHHEQRAEQQDRGARGHQRNLEHAFARLHLAVQHALGLGVRQRADQALALVDQIGRDQRGEEEALRPDQGPDGHLPAVDPGRGVVLHGVGGGVGHDIDSPDQNAGSKAQR
jgi:hypothetical protein